MQKNNSNDVINQLMEVLSSHKATCIPDTTNEQVIYVNHSKVLVRKSHTPNTHVCIELLHETYHCVWVKSWGLTSDATWLLHVDSEDNHWWFYLPTLRLLVSNQIASGTLELRNNSLRTRNRNDVNSNVVSVWVDKFNECDFIYSGTQDYTWFLSNMKRGDTL